MGKNQMTISEKWNSKFNKISVNESLQSRLKKRLRKNTVVEKRSGNKKEK